MRTEHVSVSKCYGGTEQEIKVDTDHDEIPFVIMEIDPGLINSDATVMLTADEARGLAAALGVAAREIDA